MASYVLWWNSISDVTKVELVKKHLNLECTADEIKKNISLAEIKRIHQRETSKYISGACEGEKCSMCGHDATHKVGEEILFDDPDKMRHNLTVYVCCGCFKSIFGPAAAQYCIKHKH